MSQAELECYIIYELTCYWKENGMNYLMRLPIRMTVFPRSLTLVSDLIGIIGQRSGDPFMFFFLIMNGTFQYVYNIRSDPSN